VGGICVQGGSNGAAMEMQSRCMGVEKRDVREISLVSLFDNVCRTFVLFVSNLTFMKRDFIAVLKPFFVLASDGGSSVNAFRAYFAPLFAFTRRACSVYFLKKRRKMRFAFADAAL
tara:strand:+ start:702 stop:1049 length:348 start_codon:yes stop_codon:yes gene_type:complete